VYDAVERSLAAGRETEDVTLPGSIGLPMDIGATLGLAAAWANETGTDIEGAYLAVTISWTPATRSIRPVDILPLYLDVNYQGAGHQNSYDLPAGASSRDHEFTMPVDGRLLAAGGHLHTHATELVLEDLSTGRAVVRLRTKVGGDGELVGVERKLFGVRGDGVRLHAGRRYRLTARYNNPTGEVIVNGAMGMMIGLLAPSDLAQWPAVDLASPAMRADLASLRSTTSYGTGGTGR
jgi:hypothetical protein